MPDLPLSAQITVIAEQNGIRPAHVTETIAITLTEEGDIEITCCGLMATAKTDDFFVIELSSAIAARATDQDGSESVIRHDFVIGDLPSGGRASHDGGVTFAPLGGTLASFTGTPAK
jgi:hypothetical protein